MLLGLPANFFDDHGVVFCLSRWLLGIECYACGLTRAVQHAIHLDFKVAYEFNKLVVIVLPLLIFVWGKQLLVHWKNRNNRLD